MSDKFDINICVMVLSTNIPLNKRYILSTDSDKINIPQFLLNKENYSNINETIYDYLSKNLVVSPIELRPSLLSINSSNLPAEFKKDNTLNILYGSVIVHTDNINGLFWHEFDLLKPIEYSNLIFEVVQNLS